VLKSSSLNSAASATVEASSAATGPKVYRDVRALSATADLDPLPLPAHPGLKVGRLSNGLTYVLLRNAAPAGRFEAHLEILAGSADETDAQQGMAHLVEHIAYMGSRKREALFGTGSQTNAYTDFHHTVYYASCPVADPTNPRDTKIMLHRALEALGEVLEARFEESRLTKERAAVLSEMSMVNTIEYRVECAILQALHAENRLASRFPIGLKHLIESWKLGDVQKYHQSHYKPGNAILYLVGDLPLEQMEAQLSMVVGRVPADRKAGSGLADGRVSAAATKLALAMGRLGVLNVKDKDAVKDKLEAAKADAKADAKAEAPATSADAAALAATEEAGAVDPASLKLQSRHFPPIVHAWSGGGLEVDATARIPLEYCIPAQKDAPLSVEEAQLEAAAKDCEFRLDQLAGAGEASKAGKAGVLRVFSHEMLSSVSFHLFAKRPVMPISTFGEYKASLATRVALAALQVRLNVLSRKEPLFGYVEFNVLDSSREACAVCSLDMQCDAKKWEAALGTALKELRAVALYGVTQDEMKRYVQALLADSEQLAAQGDTVASGDQVTSLMEAVACGHTFMEPETSFGVTYQALEALTLEEVNAAAYELGAHALGWDESGKRRPSALIACAPADAELTEAKILDFFDSVRKSEVIAPDLSDLVVPTSLLPPAKLPAPFDQEPSAEGGLYPDPAQVAAAFDTELEAETPGLGLDGGHDFGVTMRRLRSGVALNYRPSQDEPQRACLRLTVSGGRAAELARGPGAPTSKAASSSSSSSPSAGDLGRGETAQLVAETEGWAPPMGSIALGARTMQEGGALGGLSRTQVELFCVDQLIMVEIVTEDEFVHFNFAFPTNKVAGEDSVSGIEAVFQIVRQLMVPPAPGDPDGFVWEEDALQRAVSGLIQQEEADASSLEGAARQAVIKRMTRGDPRFTSLEAETLEALTLDQARNALVTLLHPTAVEVSVSGDFERPQLEALAARYLGSLPDLTATADKDADMPKKQPQFEVAPAKVPPAEWASKLPTPELKAAALAASSPSRAKQAVDEAGAPPALLRSPFLPPDESSVASRLDIEVPDSDPRALCHVAGVAPNKWGVMRDGTDVREALGIFPLSDKDAQAAKDYQEAKYGGSGGSGGASPPALSSLSTSARRAQPLWPAAALALVQEVLNRRLFSQVRERKGLTYDANFQLTAHERLAGGWWLVTVTSSPANSELALDACVESLVQIAPDPSRPFGAAFPLTRENLQAAQRVLVQRHTSELRSNQYWSEILSATQLESVPGKQPGNGAAYLREWGETVRAVTLEDLDLMFKALKLEDEKQFYTCIAVSGAPVDPAAAAALAADNHGHTMPSISRR